MKVTFKLFATLMPYLPAGAVKNAVELSVDDTTTVDGLIKQYSVPENLVHLVLLNGLYLQKEDRQQVMKEGDTLAIWPPVAGG